MSNTLKSIQSILNRIKNYLFVYTKVELFFKYIEKYFQNSGIFQIHIIVQTLSILFFKYFEFEIHFRKNISNFNCIWYIFFSVFQIRKVYVNNSFAK